MTISEVKRRARVSEWVQKIQEQQDSGLTIKAWCAVQGCGEGRFYYWLKVVRAEAIEHREQAVGGASLIRVEPARLLVTTACLQAAATASQQAGMSIRYGNATVEIPVGTPVAAVAELLKALNAP